MAIIRRAVSPMPIERTPGFLSRAISRQARRGEIDFGSTYDVQILLATEAREWHSSLDAALKDVHSLLHPYASIRRVLSDYACLLAQSLLCTSVAGYGGVLPKHRLIS